MEVPTQPNPGLSPHLRSWQLSDQSKCTAASHGLRLQSRGALSMASDIIRHQRLAVIPRLAVTDSGGLGGEGHGRALSVVRGYARCCVWARLHKAPRGLYRLTRSASIINVRFIWPRWWVPSRFLENRSARFSLPILRISMMRFSYGA